MPPCPVDRSGNALLNPSTSSKARLRVHIHVEQPRGHADPRTWLLSRPLDSSSSKNKTNSCRLRIHTRLEPETSESRQTITEKERRRDQPGLLVVSSMVLARALDSWQYTRACHALGRARQILVRSIQTGRYVAGAIVEGSKPQLVPSLEGRARPLPSAFRIQTEEIPPSLLLRSTSPSGRSASHPPTCLPADELRPHGPHAIERLTLHTSRTELIASSCSLQQLPRVSTGAERAHAQGLGVPAPFRPGCPRPPKDNGSAALVLIALPERGVPDRVPRRVLPCFLLISVLSTHSRPDTMSKPTVEHLENPEIRAVHDSYAVDKNDEQITVLGTFGQDPDEKKIVSWRTIIVFALCALAQMQNTYLG